MMTRGFVRNFTHSSMIARPGTRSLTACRSTAELGTKMRNSAPNEQTLVMKNQLLNLFVIGNVLAAFVGCAQIKKPGPQVKAAAVGSHFDQSGWVSLFVGEPCTPQIMFDFRSTRSVVWLAAPKHETQILTEAANSHQRVHVLGKWRHGAQAPCSYVAVTGAEPIR